MSKDNLTLLNVTDKDELIAGLEQLKRQMPQMLEMAQLTAKIRRASYDSHIAQGFTPEEALVLCQHPVGMV